MQLPVFGHVIGVIIVLITEVIKICCVWQCLGSFEDLFLLESIHL